MGTWCRSCRGPMSSSPEVRKIKTSNSQPSQTNQKIHTKPIHTPKPTLPTRPKPNSKWKITWLLKLGSRMDWQLEAVSSSPMILKCLHEECLSFLTWVPFTILGLLPELGHADSTWEVWGTEGELKLNLVSVILQRAARLELARQHLSKQIVVKHFNGSQTCTSTSFWKAKQLSVLKNECEKNHLTTICLGLTNAAAMNSKQWLLLACLQVSLFWIFPNCVHNFSHNVIQKFSELHT